MMNTIAKSIGVWASAQSSEASLIASSSLSHNFGP